jgi:hypothetical protein
MHRDGKYVQASLRSGERNLNTVDDEDCQANAQGSTEEAESDACQCKGFPLQFSAASPDVSEAEEPVDNRGESSKER